MNEAIRQKKMQIEKQFSNLEEELMIEGVLLTSHRKEIVEKKPLELLSDLKEGRLSALEVLKAFQSNALEITRKINCISEFVPEAEMFAKKCDEIPAEDRGPLHGLPVSIKESINIQGMDTTMGLAKHLYKPAISNAVIVDVLLAKGAIPFCKTNVPQACLSSCCSNPIFGSTRNPFDVTRTSGGSSGGESALISSGGSVLGIGSDLAGSVRIPATFSGCIGLKPTSSRLSRVGLLKSMPGQQGTKSSLGVMGRDVDIVTECMKSLCSSEEMKSLDSTVVPVPWNETVLQSKSKLRFGYFDSLEMFPTTPGSRRAIQVSKTALERAGHEVVPFDVKNGLEIYRRVIASALSDAGINLRKLLEREIVDPCLSNMYSLAFVSILMKPLYKQYITIKSSSLAAEIIQKNGCYKTFEYWEYLAERDSFIATMLQSFKEKNIDLLLSPAYPIPALQDSFAEAMTPACIYCAMFNYFDFPSGTVKVTKESEEDQLQLENYSENDRIFYLAKQSAKGGIGLPHGVLISGRPWEGELVCRGMKELEESLRSQSI